MIKRIIDKSGVFLRDDFTHNPSTETAANIKAKKDKAEKDRTPTIEERVAAIEKKLGI